MNRKTLFALVGAISLTVLAAGGVALAGGLAFGPKSERHDRLIAKAAAELGIEAATLESAYQQVVSDIEKENRKAALDAMVAADKITQQEADALDSWLESRPGALDKVPGLGVVPGLVWRLGPAGIAKPPTQEQVYDRIAAALGVETSLVAGAFTNGSNELGRELRQEAIEEKLDRLVADGAITQAEADELNAWLAQMPNVLSNGQFGVPGITPIPGRGNEGFRFGPRGQRGGFHDHREFRGGFRFMIPGGAGGSEFSRPSLENTPFFLPELRSFDLGPRQIPAPAPQQAPSGAALRKA